MAKSQKTDDERFIELGWLLLEHKCRYYVTIRDIIPDAEYDKLEDEYKALAKKLGRASTACDMVGFDLSRPSCMLVLHKLTGEKP